MKKALTLVIMIIIIVALSLVLGFVIGHVYQKRFSTQDNMMVKEMCKLQIYESNDRNKIEYTQKVIEKFDYKTIITKHKVDGETIYCLRLVDSYTIMEANKIIEKIKGQFPFLEDENFHTFRIEETVKVADSNKKSKSEKLKEQYTSEVKAEDKLYEIQLVSDVLLSTVETLQFKVEKQGYNTVISKSRINDSEIFKLRLDKQFDRKSGKSMIKKLQKSFPSVKGIWLADIEPDAVVLEQEKGSMQKDVVSKPTTPKVEQNLKQGNYEIQLLASQEYGKVTNLQDRLKKYNYETKITSTMVKGSKYYRLRLKDSYDSESVKTVESRIKAEVPFIKSCWVVKADHTAEVVKQAPKKTTKPVSKKKAQPVVKKSNNTKFPYSIVCKRDNINIRKGPGTNYAVDNIGRLMKGIEIYVQSEKDGWIEFTLIPEDSKWSGWAMKSLIDTAK